MHDIGKMYQDCTVDKIHVATDVRVKSTNIYILQSISMVAIPNLVVGTSKLFPNPCFQTGELLLIVLRICILQL